MPVCVNFNYPRVAPAQAGQTGTQACATKYGTVVTVGAGGAFTPLPFRAYQLLAMSNGYTTPTGRNVDATPAIDGIAPPTWPHFVKGVYVPGVAGDTAAGIYALFGQIP
jgi:hypothetical protein